MRLFIVCIAIVFVLVGARLSDARLFRRASLENGKADETVPPKEADGGDGNGASASDTLTVPFISAIIPDDRVDTELREGEGDMRRLGGFVISNPGEHPFVLQLIFANGSALVFDETSDEDESARRRRRRHVPIKLRNMELRYKDGLERDVVKPLAGREYKGGRHVYEVFFLREDAQLVYAVELWAGLDGVDVRGTRRSGVYRDEITFGIEIIP